MRKKTSSKSWRSTEGFSIIELVTVVTIASILTAIAIPQMVTQRRLTRSTELTHEIVTQLRYTRQLAMSQRQAFTFQYDDTTKQIKIIDHNNLTNVANSSTAVLADPLYPNTALSVVIATIPLTQGGLTAGEISYGTPLAAGLPTGAPVPPVGPLGDGISLTALSTNKLNITFQPDGSVINPLGIPVAGSPLIVGVPMDRAMFIFNNKAPQATLSAISVVGASGRVKVWRYTLSGNLYAE